jgi:hypothetical protein
MGVISSYMTTITTDFADISTLPGLKSLWDESLDAPGLCVAVLDRPVDQSHPCFEGVNLTRLPTLVSGVADRGSASQYGTIHPASASSSNSKIRRRY